MQNFELHFHVNKILKDGCSRLRTLELLKRYTPYYLRKQLCESLILSKLDIAGFYSKHYHNIKKYNGEIY